MAAGTVQAENLRHRRRLTVAALIVICLPLLTFGATLSDYKTRLEQARSGTDEMFEILGDDDAEMELEMRKEIEKLLPAHETVEWSGGSAETDNRWLASLLKDFAAERDETKRGAILTTISERLNGMLESIDELETATGSSASKDENKRKIAEILRREEFQKPVPKEESLAQKWLREFLEWLGSLFPRTNLPVAPVSGSGSLGIVLQVLIYALVLGLIGFVIYKLVPFFLRRSGKKTRKEKKDRVILGERVGDDDSAYDLFNEAERLAREGNLRAAIRKGYIAILCDLSDRKMVRLARHKTNRDYLRDLRNQNDVLYVNMTGLTRDFERNWYGLRIAEQADWEEFRSAYRQTIESSKSPVL